MIKTERQPLFNDWDLVFNSFYSEASDYIVNANLFFIHVQNNLSISAMLSHHIKLKIVIEYKKKDCYTNSIENIKLVSLSEHVQHINMFKMHLLNNITVYSSKFIKIVIFIKIIKTYSDLWHNQDITVNILKSDYLQISLKENWKVINLFKQIYFLKEEAHCLVNKKFDKLHIQEQIKWSIQSILFEFSVFVVWKIIIQND